MTDNTFKQKTFVLKEGGKIYYVPDVPERAEILPDSLTHQWEYDEWYKQALQSAIANGVEVSNQDEVEGKLLVIHEHHNGFKLQPDKLYPLQCKVEIREEMYMTNPPRPTGYKVARVTFEQPEKLPISKDFATQLQAQCIINERDKIEPEAAGQEQEKLWYEFLYDIGSRRNLLAGEEEPERWQEMKAFLTEKYNVVITRKKP